MAHRHAAIVLWLGMFFKARSSVCCHLQQTCAMGGKYALVTSAVAAPDVSVAVLWTGPWP